MKKTRAAVRSTTTNSTLASAAAASNLESCLFPNASYPLEWNRTVDYVARCSVPTICTELGYDPNSWSNLGDDMVSEHSIIKFARMC